MRTCKCQDRKHGERHTNPECPMRGQVISQDRTQRLSDGTLALVCELNSLRRRVERLEKSYLHLASHISRGQNATPV